MLTEIRRRRITVGEYHRMHEVGILKAEEPIELLRGDLVCKATVGDRHRACVTRLTRMLVLAFHERAAVQIQNPVVMSADSEPEPDVAILAINEGSVGGTRHAYPRDVFALIEVSDASRNLDARFKRRLYAEAAIPEYWIVDLSENQIRLNREPDSANQRYKVTRLVHPGETVAFARFPMDRFDVDEILGLAPR